MSQLMFIISGTAATTTLVHMHQNTWLFEMIVGVLTACHTQYT